MDNYIGLGCRNLEAEHHWQEIDSPAIFNSRRKKILILTGDGTETAEETNGMCKAVAQIFAGWKEPPEIYGIYYKNSGSCAVHRLHQKADCNQLDDRLYPLGRKPAPYLDGFYQQQILPLVSAQGGKKRLTVEEAAQNLRDLPVVTHCHGSTVLMELEKKLQQSMSDLGYSDKERKYILRQLFSLNIASAMPLDQTETTALHIISQADGKSVKNWRLGSLSHSIQTNTLKNIPSALLELSAHEQVMLMRSVYKPEVSEIEGESPDEHLGALYFDFKINPESRTEESNMAIKFIHQTLQNAVSAKGPLPPIPELQSDVGMSSEFIKDCRRHGKTYLAKIRRLSAQIDNAETKLWAVLKNTKKYDFSDLHTALLLVRRNAEGKTPFDFVIDRGNIEEIQNMQASIASYKRRTSLDILPSRVISNTLEKAAAAKRFDVVDCFIGDKMHGIPPVLSADKLEPDDIPVILPILQKIKINNQALYSLLPLYIKSRLISNPLKRRNCRQQLQQMLFSEKLSLRESINFYTYSQRYDESDRTPLQEGYIALASKKIKFAKDFSDIRSLEEARQSQGDSHLLYDNLTPAAKLKIEQICHKEMKRHLAEYVKAAVLRGSGSDLQTMDILYSRSLNKEQKLVFKDKLLQANREYIENKQKKNDLIAGLTTYLKQANRNVFSVPQDVSVIKQVREI